MPLSEKICRELEQVLAGKALGYTYDDVARWLRKADCVPPSTTKGSHRVWVHSSGRRIVLVEKGHGALLPVYVKRAAETLQEEECQQ